MRGEGWRRTCALTAVHWRTPSCDSVRVTSSKIISAHTCGACERLRRGSAADSPAFTDDACTRTCALAPRHLAFAAGRARRISKRRRRHDMQDCLQESAIN